MLTLRGTPFLYNGEEIGMTNLLLTDIDQFRDNVGVFVYRTVRELGMSTAEALATAAQMSRDQCRTPMQWANAPNAGFSPAGVAPWLPVNPDYAQGVNVADQLDQPDSLLNFYKTMLRLRKETPALIAGDYTPLHEEATAYFAFLRQSDEQTCLVILNWSAHPRRLAFDLKAKTARLLFSSQAQREVSSDLSQLEVTPFEIYIGQLV